MSQQQRARQTKRKPSRKLLRQIASNLKRLRRSTGLALHELAQRSGLTIHYVRNIERCKVDEDLATIEALATALGRQPHELLLPPTRPSKHTTEHRVPARWTFERPPVLSEAALAYAKKLTRDRKLAIAFLKEGGFIERPGKLARPYR